MCKLLIASCMKKNSVRFKLPCTSTKRSTLCPDKLKQESSQIIFSMSSREIKTEVGGSTVGGPKSGNPCASIEEVSSHQNTSSVAAAQMRETPKVTYKLGDKVEGNFRGSNKWKLGRIYKGRRWYVRCDLQQWPHRIPKSRIVNVFPFCQYQLELGWHV